MTETPRDFTVKVFSIKGARQTDKMHTVRICVNESSHWLTCPGNGLDKKPRAQWWGEGGYLQRIDSYATATSRPLDLTVMGRRVAEFVEASKGTHTLMFQTCSLPTETRLPLSPARRGASPAADSHCSRGSSAPS